MRLWHASSLVCCLLITAATQAAPINGLYVFGDSLSDPGNNAVALGSTASPPFNVTLQSDITSNAFIPTYPYATSHQYSNGSVWAYQFATMLGLPSQVAGPVLGGGLGANYAYGGATTGPLNNSGFPPSLLTQTAAFVSALGSAQAPADALYVVAGGGNNVRAALAAIAGGADPTTTTASTAVQFASDIGDIVDALQGKGAVNIVAWDVPNVGISPAIAANGSAAATLATTIAQSMNDALASRLASETGVQTFDIFGLLTAIDANPAAYGLTNTTDAAGAIPGADLSQYLCWDGLHPTSAGHAILAQSLYAAVVPEPSSCVLVVAGLLSSAAALRRRSPFRRHVAGATTLIALCPALACAAGPSPAAVAARADTVETEDRPVRQVRTGEGRWFADFGAASFGWLRVELPGPVAADTRLVVSLGEKKTGDDAVDAAPGGSVRFQAVEATVRAGAGTTDVVPAWKPKYPGWIEMPAGVREVMPFRYVEIAGLPAGVDEPRLVRVSRHVPFDEAASSFACSDPALEEVWRLCKHSIKATSFLGLYVDGDRERIPYEADAYINQLCHYGVDAHYSTGRLTHEHFLKNPTWPTEWRQHTPLMAWADWLYTGDDASLRTHHDSIRGRLMLDRRRGDGLFTGQNEGTPRDIVDWPEKERDGYDMRHAVKTVTSAFHARSLEAMAVIARAIGREHDAAEYAALHAATTRAINEQLFDAARGVYVDGLDAATGKRSGHASLHANMLPLAFGLVPADRIESVADFVESRGMACSVYGAQYLLDGLFDAGRERHALALLTATHDRGWLHMSRVVGSTITLEAWDAKYKPNLDWNHAWGAVPANVIPRKLMGIEPVEPGFRRIRVRPRTATLERATIRHPSPRGPIDLEVTQSKDQWQATLCLPEGVAAEVHVPTAERDHVTVVRGGHEASADVLRIDDGRCVIETTMGTTVISVADPTPAR